MASEGSISMPGVFGGLMRYHEEYHSKIVIKPIYVIVAIVIVSLLVVALKFIFPIAA